VSAQANNILPFPHERPTLEQLVDAWIAAKAKEDSANSERLAIEQLICEASPPKEEGATTVEVGGKKLTLTGKLTYKADLPKLQELAQRLPEELRPLKTEVKADEAGLKFLRKNEPQLWAVIAPAVEVKPAKTAIKVGF
jgi:hypothetical protein